MTGQVQTQESEEFGTTDDWVQFGTDERFDMEQIIKHTPEDPQVTAERLQQLKHDLETININSATESEPTLEREEIMNAFSSVVRAYSHLHLDRIRSEATVYYHDQMRGDRSIEGDTNAIAVEARDLIVPDDTVVFDREQLTTYLSAIYRVDREATAETLESLFGDRIEDIRLVDHEEPLDDTMPLPNHQVAVFNTPGQEL